MLIFSQIRRSYVKDKCAYIYESAFKPLHQPQCFGGIIHNRKDVPICVLYSNNR